MASRGNRNGLAFQLRTARAVGGENWPPAGPSVYQFKVTLKGIRPPIWRRFQVTDDITLYRLHLVLQRVMGWENCHLYQFIIGGLYYADPDPEYGTTDRSARRYKLWQVFGGRQKAKAVYEYDLGDSWEHELALEKALPVAQGARYPVCLDGARACPPEDCGGVWGYARLLEVIRNPEHEEYAETMTWLGGSFDPEAFDLDEINARLASLGRRTAANSPGEPGSKTRPRG